MFYINNPTGHPKMDMQKSGLLGFTCIVLMTIIWTTACDSKTTDSYSNGEGNDSGINTDAIVVGSGGTGGIDASGGFTNNDESSGGNGADGGSGGNGAQNTNGTGIGDTTETCGNGKIDDDEECDIALSVQDDCKSLGYGNGELFCDATCHYDISNCTDQDGGGSYGDFDADTSVPVDPNADCDRVCLIDILSSYLKALVANDPTLLKVSNTLKYTENGVIANLGEGLWSTASSMDNDKRLDFADPVEGQVASQLVINENGTSPVLYQVRLKVIQHEITEIEAMSVRRVGAANGFFIPENLRPEPVFLQPIEPNQRMTREELIAVTDLYLDYLEGKRNGAELPFDTNCVRYENGVPTASGQAAFVMQSFWRFSVTRRILVIDEEAGIVWGMFPFSQSEVSLVVGEAFKIIDGNIMMIQAVMANMPARAWD